MPYRIKNKFLNEFMLPQLTGMKCSTIRWLTTADSLCPVPSLCLSQWCIAQVRLTTTYTKCTRAVLYIRKMEFWKVSFKVYKKWTETNIYICTGLYGFYEDKENKLFVLDMPLAHKKSRLIFIMPYHVEPLERLEKLLTQDQLKTWLSKLQETAVAISLPKVSMEVSHDLQVGIICERMCKQWPAMDWRVCSFHMPNDPGTDSRSAATLTIIKSLLQLNDFLRYIIFIMIFLCFF